MPRDTRIDFLRVILIALVIGIHTICVMDYTGRPTSRAVSLSLNTIFHCAVPMYVMIIGMMFANREIISVKEFYLKRALRILIPLVPISLFFYRL
jgi:surface polysaccharide O-acyltransferase-like enzyme